MTEPAIDPDHERRLAWVRQVRSLHRWKRAAGVVGCILAVILMLWSKYSPATAPAGATIAGLALAAISFGVFAYVIFDRILWIKRHPFRPNVNAGP